MKRNNFMKLIGLFILTVFIGCHLVAKDTRVIPGAVLEPGQSIEATNKFGSVKISYVSRTKRRYEWDGQSRVVNLIVRPEPFQGREGMYDPADVWFICLRTRLVIEEYTINFINQKDLYDYLYQGSAIMDWVYTSDGLVVGYGLCKSREQVNIDVFQILLNGKKPTNIRGANPDQIRLIQK